MSFIGGGGGGGPSASDMFFQQEQQKIDAQNAAIAAQNAALAAAANNKRVQLYKTGGMAALASNGYAGFNPGTRSLGGAPATLGG